MPFKSKQREAEYQKSRNRDYKSNHLVHICPECRDVLETWGGSEAECSCKAVKLKGTYLFLRKWAEREQS